MNIYKKVVRYEELDEYMKKRHTSYEEIAKDFK